MEEGQKRVVIVTGGRDFADRELVAAALEAQLPFDVLRHGCCRTGADALADEWARSRGIEVDPVPADWTAHGRAAGPIRNRRMAQKGAHVCIAFPGGSGTRSMKSEARAAGIPVVEALFQRVG